MIVIIIKIKEIKLRKEGRKEGRKRLNTFIHLINK
jgi:hypothetical protein